jgi:hypothetical protein
MELVEGDDLSVLIGRGALPLADVLPIARQIAEALEAAHEQGIVHRDLKPANIKVCGDGTVKVLDFGLAKAMDPVGGPPADIENSPTLTARATRLGVILGTAAYMAPEQARGKVVDRRADIWAFGVVVWEMLTGRRLFASSDVSDVLAAVLRQEVDWSALPPETPWRLRRLLERCLERVARERLRDIGEARVEIAKIESGAPDTASMPVATATARRGSWRDRIAWLFGGIVAAAALAVALGLSGKLDRGSRIASPVSPSCRPPGSSWTKASTTTPRSRPTAGTWCSPDASPGGRRQLWLRALDSLEARALPGTDEAIEPFWSPDSRSVGFGADGKLKRVEVAGGAPRTLADAPRLVGGSLEPGGRHRLRARLWLGAPARAGGRRRCRARQHPLASARRGAEPAAFPARRPALPLPRGRRRPGERRRRRTRFRPGDAAARRGRQRRSALRPARVAAVGARRSARRAGVRRREPEALRRAVARSERSRGRHGPRRPLLGVGQRCAGVAAPRDLQYQLLWLDRSGRQVGEVGMASKVSQGQSPELSPDGRQLAIQRADAKTRNTDLWVIDIARGVFRRLTSDPVYDQLPVWTPDGRSLFFTRQNLRRLALDGSADALVLAGPNYPKSVSPDGRFLVYVRRGETTRADIWALPLAGDRTPCPHPGCHCCAPSSTTTSRSSRPTDGGSPTART